jgi:hypothetical protein
MAIQMTRKEYEAKYGTAPVISDTPTTSVTPIKMTRAEYEAKYPTEKKQGYLERVKSGLSDIKGEVESEISKSLLPVSEFAQKPTISELPEAILGTGRTGLRIAGGAARALFTPILEAPGIKQATEFVVGKALEVPAIQEVAKFATDLAVKYPNAAKDARDIFDIVTTFYAPAAGKIVTKEAGLVAKDIGKAAKIVMTPSEEAVQSGIVKTFQKSIKPTAKKTLATGEKYENNILTALKTIKANADKLNIEDSTGELVSRTPKNLNEFAQSVEQSKALVFNQYDSLAKLAGKIGVEVDTNSVIKELENVIQNKALRITNPELIKYTTGWIERLTELGSVDTQTMQEVIKNLNTSLQAFYKNPAFDSAQRASIDAGIANQFRKLLDETIEGATGGEYQALKNQYASLKAIENDVVRASMRDARKNVKGLLDYTDIFTGGQMIGGVLSLNPSMFTKGAIERGFKEYIKFLNDPNRAVSKMFEKLEIDTNLKFNPESEVGKYLKNPKLGLSIEDISKNSSVANQSEGVSKKLLSQSKKAYSDTTTSSKVSQSLSQQAPKYKTAEEFVYQNRSPKSIENIITEGLKSGETGSSGAGTYFALSEKSLPTWAKKGDVQIRIKKEVASRFGGLKELSADEAMLPKTGLNIPPEAIEIKIGNNWMSLPKTKSQLIDIWNKANKKPLK